MDRLRRLLPLLVVLALLAGCGAAQSAGAGGAAVAPVTSQVGTSIPPPATATPAAQPTATATATPTPMATPTVAPTATASPTVARVATPDPLAALRRPLQLPALAPGDPCPIGEGHEGLMLPYESFLLYGPGPIYQVGGKHWVNPQPEADGWRWGKEAWVSAPGFAEPVLIRGRRIDGPGELRFDIASLGVSSVGEFVFPTHTNIGAAASSAGWRYLIMGLGAQVSGCYAYQVDGPTFSYVIAVTVGP